MVPVFDAYRYGDIRVSVNIDALALDLKGGVLVRREEWGMGDWKEGKRGVFGVSNS